MKGVVEGLREEVEGLRGRVGCCGRAERELESGLGIGVEEGENVREDRGATEENALGEALVKDDGDRDSAIVMAADNTNIEIMERKYTPNRAERQATAEFEAFFETIFESPLV